ncbi:hypothetical protein NPIL_36431 [Nephila pilipes]|uniref:Uncharacterized protein n=1 Tax=Nephila pilipes TaxID=299642 RepID=A0A8X6TQD1_NEPPI|nr:hypothetical protein NPIL_36431 [Nephila pilipes]
MESLYVRYYDRHFGVYESTRVPSPNPSCVGFHQEIENRHQFTSGCGGSSKMTVGGRSPRCAPVKLRAPDRDPLSLRLSLSVALASPDPICFGTDLISIMEPGYQDGSVPRYCGQYKEIKGQRAFSNGGDQVDRR